MIPAPAQPQPPLSISPSPAIPSIPPAPKSRLLFYLIGGFTLLTIITIASVTITPPLLQQKNLPPNFQDQPTTSTETTDTEESFNLSKFQIDRTLAYIKDGNIFILTNSGTSRITLDGLAYLPLKWSPNGQLLGWRAQSQTGAVILQIYDVSSQKVSDIGFGDQDTSFDFSPNSKQVVYSRTGDIFINDTEKSNEVKITNKNLGKPETSVDDITYQYPNWNPVSSEILICETGWESGATSLYNVSTGKLMPLKMANDVPDICGEWSPNGSKILIVSQTGKYAGGAWSVDPKSGNALRIIGKDNQKNSDMTDVDSLALSTDGQTAAIVRAAFPEDGTFLPATGDNIYLVNESGKLTPLTLDSTSDTTSKYSLSWIPGNRFLTYLTAGKDINSSNLNLLSIDGNINNIVLKDILVYAWKPDSRNSSTIPNDIPIYP